MKTSYLFKHSNYLTPRTAIEREQKQFIKIAFAVHLSAVISAERYRSDSGALKSAVLTLVYFYIIMIVHKCQQSAKRKLLLNKNNLSEVFPFTVVSGKTMPFGNRWSRYKELEKKVPQTYRVYVEETFLSCDAGDARIFSKEEDVYGIDYGFGLDAPKETEQANPQDLFAYRRNYTWNERNLLTKSSDRNFTVHYRYGDDGQRALKYTDEGRSETLYFNNFFTIHIPTQDQNNPQGLRVHKHIFVGNSRLVTAMTHTDNHGDNEEQKAKRYYYHSDHLGSAQFVTDWKGRQYEHIEYTPYGELWVEEVAAGLDKLPFRFTGKELDEETGLYYYGARYLDPKYSRWLSGDPALGEYVPKAPIDEEAKKHNENLPGMGGVFNTVNLHVYHYAGNNPVKYTDPDGRDIIYKDDDGNIEKIESSSRNEIHTPASDRELLEENAKEMKKHALNISYFYKKVKSHGDWDFKNFKEEDGKRGWYWFNGKLVTAEEFGNLHYGYVGAAGGFSTLLLIEAPGIAQVKAGTAMAGFWLTNFDDPRDTQNILRGIYAYDGSLGNKITRTIGDHFYLSFCFTSFRIFTFTAFILENKLKRRK